MEDDQLRTETDDQLYIEKPIDEIADKLYSNRGLLNEPPIPIGSDVRIGFRSNNGIGVIGLFDKTGKPIGIMALRIDRDPIICWKGRNELMSICGAPNSPFENDRYFGNLYTLIERYSEDTGLDPAILIGFDEEQRVNFRNKGLSYKLVSVAIEISQKMGKPFAFREAGKEVERIVQTMTTKIPTEDDKVGSIFVPYEGLRRVVYPKSI